MIYTLETERVENLSVKIHNDTLYASFSLSDHIFFKDKSYSYVTLGKVDENLNQLVDTQILSDSTFIAFAPEINSRNNILTVNWAEYRLAEPLQSPIPRANAISAWINGETALIHEFEEIGRSIAPKTSIMNHNNLLQIVFANTMTTSLESISVNTNMETSDRNVVTFGGSPSVSNFSDGRLALVVQSADTTQHDQNSIFYIQQGLDNEWDDRILLHRGLNQGGLAPKLINDGHDNIYAFWGVFTGGMVLMNRLMETVSVDGENWTTPTFIEGINGIVFDYQLVFDSIGRLHLLYLYKDQLDSADTILYHKMKVNNSWTNQTKIASNMESFSFDIDNNGLLHIIYVSSEQLNQKGLMFQKRAF
jgi:hypothetical protein